MQVTPNVGANIRLQYTNGTVDPFAKYGTPISPYKRRFGEGSIITSSSGVDGRFRPVSHSKETYVAHPLTTLPPYLYAAYVRNTPYSSSTVWNEWIYRLYDDVHQKRYTQFTAACESVQLSLASVQWEAMSAKALNQMLPSFHTDNSLVNFILELKDFKNVVKYFDPRNKTSNQLSAVEAFLGMNFRGIKSYHPNSAKGRKTMKQLSKGYLSVAFGWIPFYKDMVSFVKTISAFTRRYDELIARADKPQQSYYGEWLSGTAQSETLYFSTEAGGGDGPTGGWVGPFLGKVRTKVSLGSTQGIRYHATIRYRYAIPSEIRSVVGRLRAFLDTLGVSQNPAILWNAIPFSFIIDWFVDVSGYLERLRIDNIEFKTEILDFCHSAKIERTIDMQMAGSNYNYAAGGEIRLAYLPTDSCTKSVYERKLGLPNFLTAMQTSGLDWRKFSLAGALYQANKR